MNMREYFSNAEFPTIDDARFFYESLPTTKNGVIDFAIMVSCMYRQDRASNELGNVNTMRILKHLLYRYFIYGRYTQRAILYFVRKYESDLPYMKVEKERPCGKTYGFLQHHEFSGEFDGFPLSSMLFDPMCDGSAYFTTTMCPNGRIVPSTIGNVAYCPSCRLPVYHRRTLSPKLIECDVCRHKMQCAISNSPIGTQVDPYFTRNCAVSSPGDIVRILSSESSRPVTEWTMLNCCTMLKDVEYDNYHPWNSRGSGTSLIDCSSEPCDLAVRKFPEPRYRGLLWRLCLFCDETYVGVDFVYFHSRRYRRLKTLVELAFDASAGLLRFDPQH